MEGHTRHYTRHHAPAQPAPCRPVTHMHHAAPRRTITMPYPRQRRPGRATPAPLATHAPRRSLPTPAPPHRTAQAELPAMRAALRDAEDAADKQRTPPQPPLLPPAPLG